ncbi:aminotransferase class III-fold pyridoxal phosphate-dependent enzyme, partial [Campylobacter upsaliensis]|nr:aminotransferase class III-fold pyridoxal phosphate-dependent enzyme [Campylobacter upsaliensis]
ELTSEFDFCEERRGLGFMQGLRLNAKIKVADVLKKCRENRLLLLSCSKNDLRFLPPLIIEKEHIDVMAEKLRAVLRGF